MTITPREGLNQFKTHRVHPRDSSYIIVFFLILLQISDNMTSTEARQDGGSAQDPSRKTMTPWTFDIKFLLGTRFTFRSLTFAVGEDEDLKMLPQDQRQSIPLLLPHLHQTILAQIWIRLQGYTFTPSSSFRVFRS
jgi:hypothetical protein